MGKKQNLAKRQTEKDLDARALRKRDEHMPKQVACAAANEDSARNPRTIANDTVETRQCKGKAKERKGDRWQPERKVHRAHDKNVLEDKIIPEVHETNVKEVNIEVTTETPMKTNNDDIKQSTSNITATEIINPSPKVPRWDMKKLQEIIEKSKTNSILKLNEDCQKEIIETEDLMKLSRLPRFNGISKGIECIVNDITKRNEKARQELMEKCKKQQEEFRTIFNEEFFILTDLRKYETALDELKSILRTEEKTNCEGIEIKSIPSSIAFKETTGMLRTFIAVRNDRLVKCFATDFRRNKVGDNYTNLLCQFERNKGLMKYIRKNRFENKLGYRVQNVSTKVLEKILNQLRNQTKKLLTKNASTTWKQWNKKICGFDSMVELHHKNIDRMKACLAVKRKNKICFNNSVNEIDEQIKLSKLELKDAEMKFETKTTETKPYTEKVLIVTQKKKILEDIRLSYQKDLLTIDPLKIKLEECKQEERNIDYLYEDVNNITSKIQSNKEEWREIEKLQFQLKEEIRLKNGIMLRHEEIQQEIQSEKIRCKDEYLKYATQLENANYQKEKLEQKLRYTTNQVRNYQHYWNFAGKPLQTGLALSL